MVAQPLLVLTEVLVGERALLKVVALVEWVVVVAVALVVMACLLYGSLKQTILLTTRTACTKEETVHKAVVVEQAFPLRLHKPLLLPQEMVEQV